MRGLEASLTALMGSSENAADMLNRIKTSANALGLPVDKVAESSQRLIVSLNELGGGNAQVQGIVEAFAMMGRVAGTSVDDINGALVQMSQSLGAGTLQWDELKIILERMPIVARELAKELGVAPGQLKKMASDGELAADKVGNALIRVRNRLAETIGGIPTTSQQAFVRVQNQANELAQAIEKAFNLSAISVAGFDAITIALANIKNAVNDTAKYFASFTAGLSAAWDRADFANKTAVWATAIGTVVAVLGGPLVTAIQAVGAAMMAKPMLAAIGVIAGGVLLIAANWDKVKVAIQEGIPASLAKVEQAFYSVAAKVVEIWSSAANAFVNVWIQAINVAIEKFNALGASVPKWLGGGFSIPAVEEFNLLGQSVDDLNAKADEAGKRFQERSKAYQEEMGKIDAAQKKIAEFQPIDANLKPGTGGKGAGGALKDQADALQQLLDKLFPAEKAAREMQAAIEQLNTALAAGTISPEKYAEAIKKIPEAFSEKGGVKDTLQEILDQMNSFTKQFVDGIVDAMFEGKLNMEKLLKDMAKSIVKWLLNSQIQKFFKALEGFGKESGGFLGGIFGGLFGGGQAQGGAWNKGVQMFAQGGIVGSPTAFGMANGRIGVMGEAGPEAIVPLKRSASGDLGVRSSPVNIIVHNNAPVEVTTTESEKPDGTKQIELTIERTVAKAINNGSLDKQFRAAYGITRQGY